ncbi:MAG: ATP-dependent DNA ligase [Methanomassiliicoccales archaeon]
MPTSIRAFADLCEQLESTSSRKKKAEILANFLLSVDRDEIRPAVLLTLGRAFPESDSRNLDIGYATISKAWSSKKQSMLLEEELTLNGVIAILDKIAGAQGAGSRRVKEHLLQNLFGRVTAKERECIARSVFGEMRTGVNDGTVLDSIALASGAHDLEGIRNAYMLSGDIARTAEIAILSGPAALERIGPVPCVPIKPMLAESVGSVEEALSILKKAAFEFKLDGARVQIHKKGNEVRIYSRRLTDLTDSLPEIVDLIRKSLTDEITILEGEVIAFRERPLPFQHVMRRITKVHDIRGLQETVPVKLYVFDILMKERESLVNVVLRDRWSILERTVPGDLLVPRTVTADPMVAIDFYNRALSEGHEGLMAKDLQSVYAVGRRGKKWLKVKKSQTLDLVIIAAEWGYGKREGWLSDYHLAAVSGEGYSMVGKTFKGLTDEEFKWMTERLLATAVRKSEHVVEVRPTLVVEVAFDEIQESPTYQSGLTLRFARIKNIRQDKDPPDADTIETMRAMYEGQFRTKDRFASNDGR